MTIRLLILGIFALTAIAADPLRAAPPAAPAKSKPATPTATEPQAPSQPPVTPVTATPPTTGTTEPAAEPAGAAAEEPEPDAAALPPMLEALKPSSKLFGERIAKPGALDRDNLVEHFFKKTLLEHKETFGVLLEAMAGMLEQESDATDKAAEAKILLSRVAKLSKWLESWRSEKELTPETIDFCLLYLRMRSLSKAPPENQKDLQKAATALEKDLNGYINRFSKQPWGPVLLALHRDLAGRRGFKTELDKSPEEYLSGASALSLKDAQIHFLIGQLLREYLDRRDVSNFLKQVATEFEKCLLQQRRNKELFAEVTAVYVEIHEALQKRQAQEPFWFEELVYKRIIALDPSNASAHNNLSFLYSQYGVNLKDALREAQIANQLKPNDPLLLDTLGWAHYKNGQLEKAIETLKQSLALNQEIADTHFHLATVYYDQSDVDNASREFRETLRLEPENAFARNNLAYLFSEKDLRLEEALVLADEALERQPDNAAFLDTKGWIYFKMRKYPEAIEFLQKAVDLSPETSELHLHLGKVYLATRDFDRAVKSFESALSYDPENTKIARDLAYLFTLNGIRESLDRYSRIGGVGASKENFKIFYDAMAHAAIGAGDYENASKTLAEFAAFQPRAAASTGATTAASSAARPLHEQLEALGEVLPASFDLVFSVERAGLAKLAGFFTKAISERYGFALPQLTGLDSIPSRLVLGLQYVDAKNATDFLAIAELPDAVFDELWGQLEGLKEPNQEVTLPIGNMTVPIKVGGGEYKGVAVRSLTMQQGVVHFLMSKPYAVFGLDRALLTGLIDRVEKHDKGLTGVETYRRFAMRQTKASDIVLFMPFSKTASAQKLPEPYLKTFKDVRAFGAAYTVVSTDELLEESVFMPARAEGAQDLRKNLEQLLGTVQKDIHLRLSQEIRLEAKFSHEEDLVIGESKVLGFGKLVLELLGNWYKTYLPNLDLTPNAPPTKDDTPEEEPSQPGN
ncbi:MAG: tetratricopeptide repeat protein [Candidatus Wallbacteria bacterium]|nr:tetratricopeptide repeat protein [Candidatus Wallbacteria bacterium]